MAPAVRRHLHVVLAPSSAECGARLPQISRLELARKPKAPWLLKWSRGHCDVTTAWPLDNSTMPPLILQLRVLLRAFSSSSPRQAFLTLYSSLIYPFCFVHFMIFHFQAEFIGLTILYPVNHPHPFINPFFDLILHIHFVLPPCALSPFISVPHLIVTDTAPYHTPTSVHWALFICSSTAAFTKHNAHICLQPHHSTHIPLATLASRP